MSDCGLDELIERDPFAALCRILDEVGATLTFHGVPVTEQEMRTIATRSAINRLESIAAPALLPGPQPEEHW